MLPNKENASFEPSGDQVGSVAPQVTLSDSDASVITRRLSSATPQAARINAVVLLDGRVMHRKAAGSLHRLANHPFGAGEIGIVEVRQPSGRRAPAPAPGAACILSR